MEYLINNIVWLWPLLGLISAIVILLIDPYPNKLYKNIIFTFVCILFGYISVISILLMVFTYLIIRFMWWVIWN